MKRRTFIKIVGIACFIFIAGLTFTYPHGSPPGPGYRLVNGHVQIVDVNKDLIYGNVAGIMWLILSVILAVYGAYMTIMVLRKQKEAEELIERLKKYERHWDLKLISARVNEIYVKMQSAMVKRDQEIAREFISEKLYENYKALTAAMIKDNEAYVVKKTTPLIIRAAGVEDHPAEDKDTMWLVIKGSRIDYIKSTMNNKLLIGDGRQADNFEELWKLVRKESKWILDELTPCADSKILIKIKNQTTALSRSSS